MTAALTGLGYQRWALDAILLLPLLGAVLVMLSPPPAAKRLALYVTLAEFVASLGLWWTFEPTAAMQFQVVRQWIPEWGIAYRLCVVGFFLFFFRLTHLL